MPNRRVKIVKKLNYNIKDEDIMEYCKTRGLKKEIGKTVILFLNNTIDEVCDELYISPQTLDYRLKRFIDSE